MKRRAAKAKKWPAIAKYQPDRVAMPMMTLNKPMPTDNKKAGIETVNMLCCLALSLFFFSLITWLFYQNNVIVSSIHDSCLAVVILSPFSMLPIKRGESSLWFL